MKGFIFWPIRFNFSVNACGPENAPRAMLSATGLKSSTLEQRRHCPQHLCRLHLRPHTTGPFSASQNHLRTTSWLFTCITAASCFSHLPRCPFHTTAPLSNLTGPSPLPTISWWPCISVQTHCAVFHLIVSSHTPHSRLPRLRTPSSSYHPIFYSNPESSTLMSPNSVPPTLYVTHSRQVFTPSHLNHLSRSPTISTFTKPTVKPRLHLTQSLTAFVRVDDFWPWNTSFTRQAPRATFSWLAPTPISQPSPPGSEF